jgi:pimeloyl-ACP methyl ester carboxylesterase
MKNHFLWTQSKARLQFLQKNGNKNYHWFLLPGGPGLGSESLRGLAKILSLPGSVWLVDLPGDGSNIVDAKHSLAQWSEALREVCSLFPQSILVAHSTGGMFALATPALKKSLAGLVLVNSAPNAAWQQSFSQYSKQHPIIAIEKLQKIYLKKPSDVALKKLTIASIPYFSTAKNAAKMRVLLNTLPFNYKACEWAAKNFDLTYRARWIPDNIPTLILSGDQDPITPMQLFTQIAAFNHPNIMMKVIKKASHFPWIDNPKAVKQAFAIYCKKLHN